MHLRPLEKDHPLDFPVHFRFRAALGRRIATAIGHRAYWPMLPNITARTRSSVPFGIDPTTCNSRISIPDQRPSRDSVNAISTHHRAKRSRLKQLRNGGVEDVEAAGEGPERGQDHARTVGDKTAAAQTARSAGDAGAGVQVAGDLAICRCRLRFVAKNQTRQIKLGAGPSGQVAR